MPVDQHRVCTAASVAATEARSLETEVVAQDVEQGSLVVIDVTWCDVPFTTIVCVVLMTALGAITSNGDRCAGV